MIHPHTELKPINPVIGFGVFATASIPRGTIIWSPDPLDRVLTRAELAVLPELFATFERVARRLAPPSARRLAER